MKSSSPGGRPHYSQSCTGLYPTKLHNYQYQEPISLLSSPSSAISYLALQYDPSHHQGHLLHSLDLRYWDVQTLVHYFDPKYTIKSINFSSNSQVNDDVLASLEQVSATLMELKLSYCRAISSFGLMNLTSLQNLTSLSLEGLDSLKDSDVHGLTRNFSQITLLNISYCPRLTDQSLLSLSSSIFCHQFLKLFANGNSNFTYQGTNPLLINCSHLTHLEFADCSALTYVGISVTADTTYSFNEKSTIQYVTRGLQYLNMSNCPLIEESLDWIASACPDLIKLDVSGINLVTNQFVQGICLGCPLLKSLNLRGCRRLDSTGLLPLSRCLCRHHLEYLDISQLSRQKPLESVVVKEILQNCPSLTFFDISGQHNLSDEAFMLSNNTSNHSLMLKKLCVSKCNLLSSVSIVLITSRFRYLQEINLSNLSLVTNEGISALAINCNSNLLLLNVCECLQLSDSSLEEISKHCKNLSELYLGTNVSQTDAWGGRITQYSDKGLQFILSCCRKLRVLDLRNQCGITLTSTWFKAAKKLKNIERQLPSRGIGFSGHVSLQSLNMFGCDKVSRQNLATLLSKCFSLNHVILPQGPIVTGALIDSDFVDEELPPDDDEIPDQTFESFNDEISVGNRSHSTNSKQSSITSASKKSKSILKSSESTVTVETTTSSVVRRKQREQLRLQKVIQSKKQFWFSSFRYTCYSSPVYKSSDGQSYKWGGLFPHDFLPAWSYRDALIRRRLDELWAARKIQYFYRFTINYRSLKNVNTIKYLQRWFRHYRREKQLSDIKDRLYVLSCALKIQRNFRKNLLPLLRNILKIQKIVRGWRGRVIYRKLLLKNQAAKSIQKMVRGMLVRLSDRYILTQIYVKLPPFWKTVIHSCAPEEADSVMGQIGKFVSRHTYTDYTKHYQILKATRDVRAMISGIETNRLVIPDISSLASGAAVKTFNLAPKLPFIVPQSFDKSPYVSRADGKKLAFFSEENALLKKDLDHDIKSKSQSLYASKAALTFGLDNLQSKGLANDIHQYTFTFWPVVSRPKEESAGDVTLFNPMLNGFDVRQNMKETLHCELCGIRLRLILCHICCKGYCFFCAFKAHIDGTKRNHKMDMMEPRVVEVKEADTSLIYHLDMVQKTTYDIKYLVNFLKSASEVKRIRKERELAREMEELEVKRALEAKKYAKEAAKRHHAATKIANLYRERAARKYVREKRNQHHLESLTLEVDKYRRAAIKIQKRFRVYSVRIYFAKQVGVKFRVDFTKKKKKQVVKRSDKEEARRLAIKKEAVRKRVEYDVQQRRYNQRNQLIFDMYTQYAHVLQTLESNTHFWLDEIKDFPSKIEALKEQRKQFKQEHKKQELILQASSNLLMAPDKDLVGKVKSLYLKRGACTKKIDHLQSTKWWLTHHIRANCRRMAVIKGRVLDTIDRCLWIKDEDYVVERIGQHLEARIELLKDVKELRFAVDWMKEFVEYTYRYRAKLDATQESVITEELRRLALDMLNFTEVNSLVMELMQAMKMDSQYASERVHLDSMAFFAPPGSDEAVSLGDRTLVLKMKQQQLETSVLDRVKMGLDAKFTEEDTRYIEIASFPTDSPDLEPDEMLSTITAKIIDRHIPKKHFEIKQFIDLLYSQPWMAKQAIEDVHMEEVIRTKALALDHLESTATALERSIVETTNEITSFQRKIEEIQFANDLFETETPGDHDPQTWETMVKQNQILLEEKQKLEANIRVHQSDLERYQIQLPPKRDRIEVASMQLAKMRDALDQRNSDRKRVLNMYFTREESHAKALSVTLVTDIQNMTAKLSLLREKGRALETAAARGIPEKLIDRTADLESQELLNESNYKPIYTLQDAMRRVTPHLQQGGLRLIELMLEVKISAFQSVIHHYQFREQTLGKEVQLFSDFASTKSYHQDRMDMFLSTQLNMRRQHALQKEIDQRVARLNDLRQLRMDAIKKLREKAKEEERIRAELEAQKKKAQEKPLTTVIAEGIKNGIRQAADDYRKMKARRQNGMTAEEERMAGYLRKKNATGSVEAIRKIRITGTREETEQFQRQNDILFQKGLPYYRMMERCIGSQGDVYLWFEMTKVPEEMITSLELSHSDPRNERHKRLETFGYEKVSNPAVKLEIYVKRDKRKDRAINAMRVSYEESEEARFTVDQYQRVDDGVSLTEFGLPDVYLWTHRIDKGEKTEAANTNALMNELKATRKMLKNRPNDTKLKELVQKLEKQMDAAMHNEIAAQVTDPLAYAVEILALGEKDLKKFMKVYQKIDKTKAAKISVDDLFEFLGLPPTEFNLHMIHSLESLGSDGMLEFGDFLRTFAVFCLFGKDDILRLCFTFADTDNAGKITHAQFIRLLNQLHPYDKTRTKRALAELDLSPTKEMDYDEFLRINGILPTLLYPAFQLQFIMREKTMGDDWWVKKLLAYRSVREKLAGSRLNADEAAATEMERIARDEARKKRMDDRAQRILQTSSALEKAILNARQLADEFS